MQQEIESMLKEERTFLPPPDFRERAYIQTVQRYEELYRESIEQPDVFWARQAEENLHWFKKWDRVCDYDFSSIGNKEEPYIRYFIGGQLNVSYNCLDKNVEAGLGEC